MLGWKVMASGCSKGGLGWILGNSSSPKWWWCIGTGGGGVTIPGGAPEQRRCSTERCTLWTCWGRAGVGFGNLRHLFQPSMIQNQSSIQGRRSAFLGLISYISGITMARTWLRSLRSLPTPPLNDFNIFDSHGHFWEALCSVCNQILSWFTWMKDKFVEGNQMTATKVVITR